jgi:predicted phage terminase large subunit-like protein
VQAALSRRSLAHFFRYSWPVLEPGTTLIWNWHLEAVCNHTQALLEGRIPSRNLAINVPPGSSKSRIVSVCANAWWWIDHPEWRGIFTSANPRNVTRDSVYCRQLIDSAWYQESFSPKWGWAPDQNAKNLYRNTRGGFRQSVGGGSGVTGDRANGLFMDDMLDATKGESKAAREEFHTFYDQAFANRVSSMTEGTRCIIAQRLHEADPVGHLLKSGDWELLVIRQEYELEKVNPNDPASLRRHRPPSSIGWSDPRRVEGDLMDPVRFPAEELAKEKRRLGSRGYSAQHQQRPAPAEGAILKRQWFRWYSTPRGADGEFLPPLQRAAALGITMVGQAADTAQTEKTSADFTAEITGGKAPNRIYILDLWKDKIESPAVKANIKAAHAKWMASVVVIEGGSSASGKAVAQGIRSDSTLPVIELPVMGDKVACLNAVAPTVEAGVVYLPDDQPWALELIESLIAFPTGEHDDDVDAFRILLWYFLFGGAGLGMLEWARQEAERAAAAKADQKATMLALAGG